MDDINPLYVKIDNLSIDFEAEAAYLTVDEILAGEEVFTVEHNPNVYIDYDSRGNLKGFELLDLEAGFPVEEMTENNSDLCHVLTKANETIKKQLKLAEYLRTI